MNRIARIATNILLGCLIVIAMTLHIRFLMWERGGFAAGGEWIVYLIAIVYYLWRVCYDD